MTACSRYTADMDGDFVVFLTGMRINAFWKIHRWLPILVVATRILWELRTEERPGLRHSRLTVSWRGVTVIQYWDSFDDLRAYAHDSTGEHHDAWIKYVRDVADSGAVGGWHETFLVCEDAYEAIYNQMPEQGLAAAGRTVPADAAGNSAASRLGRTDGTDVPITPQGRMDDGYCGAVSDGSRPDASA